MQLKKSNHTLSKAFEISRNIPRTSSPLSNSLKISPESPESKESPDLNPDWFGEKEVITRKEIIHNVIN